MTKAVLDLAVRSLWLWCVTGVLVWAVIGGLAASWLGLRVMPAVAVSACVPALGVGAVLLWGRRERGRPPAASRPRRPVLASLGRPAPESPSSPEPSPVPWSAGPARTPWSEEPVPAVDALKERDDDVRPPAVLVAGIAGLVGVLLAAALPLSWFSIRPVDLVLGEYTGASTVVTGVPLLACALALIACGLLQAARPRRLWSLVALLCSAPWLVLGGQVLLAADDLSRITGRLTGLASTQVRVDVASGPGAYLLLAAGLVGLGWAAWTALSTHRLAGPARTRGRAHG